VHTEGSEAEIGGLGWKKLNQVIGQVECPKVRQRSDGWGDVDKPISTWASQYWKCCTKKKIEAYEG